MLIEVLYGIGTLAGIHALLTKRNSHSALIWLTICVMFPVIGALAYLIFGVNRIKAMKRQWMLFGIHQQGEHTLLKPLPNPLDRLDHQNPDQMRLHHALNITAGHISTYPLFQGCQILPLFDGTEAYPAMLRAIEHAEKSIYLCTYIFGSRGIGLSFIEALERAHHRGVDVKVLIDGVGALYAWPTAYRQLKNRGVPARLFLPPFRKWYYTLHVNLRDHQKILVVDGKIGFTGGLNIHESNMARAPHTTPKISDLHFQVEGPVVSALQDTVLRGWYFSAKGETPPHILYFDDALKGSMLARGIATGPHRTYPQLHYMLITAIQCASQKIRILTPYLVLSTSLGSALNTAALRGVEIEIILPEHNNLSFVKGACETQMPSLLKAGIKIFYQQGAFAHTKLVLIDDCCAFIGSANLDIRSLYLNFEFNLQVMDIDFTQNLSLYFEKLKVKARKITLEFLHSQHFLIKLRNNVYKLFSPYL